MKHLRELRKAANLTQTELGNKMHLSVSSIASYEKGRRTPDAGTALKLANFFGVSVEYILDESELPYPAGLPDSGDMQLIRDIYALPLPERKLLLKLIQDYVELNERRKKDE